MIERGASERYLKFSSGGVGNEGVGSRTRLNLVHWDIEFETR
jgi:hypothetical protein